jgi:hypothetical protein
VYYAFIVVGLLLAAGALLVWTLTRPGPARAQVDVSLDPAMTKGPADAVVTIIEFSDYQ